MSDRYFYIENLGCAKNQVDAEIMAASLEEAGWIYTEEARNADLIIINSCGFIAPAREEAIRTVLGARQHYGDAKILFAGCMAQRYGARMLEELPELDGVFGNFDPPAVKDIAPLILDGKREIRLPDHPSEAPDVSAPERSGEANGELPGGEGKGSALCGGERKRFFNYPGSAYLRISEGCNHCCSYCAIPLIRGKLRSRSMDAVLREAKQLLTAGIREINLVAQDLAAFGTDRGRSEFPVLLSRLSELPGTFWIRLLYIHPDHFPEEILPIMKADPRILPYFDIPFQHAHPDILRSMGRTGDRESYLDLIRTIREQFPQGAIRSTFLLGYPGEGRRQFQELQRFIQDARLDWAGFFIFSPEEGTRAAKLRGGLGHRFAIPWARRRLRMLQELQESISFEKSALRAEGEITVLIEEEVKGEELALGRTWFQAPEVDGITVVSGEGVVPGTMARCRLRRSNGLDMEATLI